MEDLHELIKYQRERILALEARLQLREAELHLLRAKVETDNFINSKLQSNG